MKNSTHISLRSTALALTCLAAISLSGCVNDEFAMDDTRSTIPYSGSEAHPINVVKGPITLQVSSAQGTLQPNQINAISGFVNQAMSAGITPISIARPSGGGASARVASEVAALMIQQGVSRNMMRIGTYAGPASGAVLLSYVSTYAATKPCGEWPEDLGDTNLNGHSSSHGCAVQANIAAMIADPSTLVAPAPATPILASTRTKGVRTLDIFTNQTTAAAAGSSTP